MQRESAYLTLLETVQVGSLPPSVLPAWVEFPPRVFPCAWRLLLGPVRSRRARGGPPAQPVARGRAVPPVHLACLLRPALSQPLQELFRQHSPTASGEQSPGWAAGADGEGLLHAGLPRACLHVT